MVKTVVQLFAFLLAISTAGICLAQEQESSSIGAADDCSQISVDFVDDPNLTRQEKTELMDRALLNSLNKYERCQNSQTGASSASGGGDAGGSGEAGEAGETGSGGQVSSTASAEMSGTQPDVEQQGSTSDDTTGLAEPVAADKHNKSDKNLGNGKVPDDIPPADNDSILEEQIRQAAINETDPVIKEKLWNEYRKYKGLPLVRKP